MGEMKKSSANPVEIKTVADIFIEQVRSMFWSRPI